MKQFFQLAAFGFSVGIAWLTWLDASPARAMDASPEGIEFFEKRIRPILVNHCYECHSIEGKTSEGGLLVDSRAGLLKGGESGPALVPGNPDKSLFIVAIQHTEKELRMPPDQKLSVAQRADLVAWVKMGAPDPRQSVAATVATASQRPKSTIDIEAGRKFWSLQPLRADKLPQVKNTNWPRTSIDHFVLAKLEEHALAPNHDADKRTLLRRVTFDLTGLPPTPDELASFLSDASPDAFAVVVDRLLASPRYGERWGRHWLDVVRYADTCGNASDYPVPQAHKYRDWVIRAFNRDLPYDQFLREQIAGDLLSSDSDAERHERIVATGYLAMARRFGGSREGEFHLTLEDTIDNLGRTILGSSLACARCHDHKFDPFTMSDYYGLFGILSSTRYPFPGAEASKVPLDFVPLMPPDEITALLKPHREKLSAVDAQIKLLEAEAVGLKKLPEGDEKVAKLKANTQAIGEAKKSRQQTLDATPVINDAYAVAEGKPINARIQVRGDPKRLGDEVARHFPVALGGQELPRDFAASGRLQLAEWLVDRNNPLTARVMVNRLWQNHFGSGLVQTPNDFGRQGRAPTHPELLDHLAAQFMRHDWSIKAMHKQILLSHTWQQASDGAALSEQRDPQNELLGRFSRRRLDAEAIRDTLLFVSGTLDESSTGGHPFPATHSWTFSQHKPFVAVYESKRRSVYLMQQRQRKNPYLALFDGADPSTSTGARLLSTTPLQALFLMNDPLTHGAAKEFAQRVTTSTSDELTRLATTYRWAFSRVPSDAELAECREFLQTYRTQLSALKTPADQLESQAWSALARALMSSNEFIFID